MTNEQLVALLEEANIALIKLGSIGSGEAYTIASAMHVKIVKTLSAAHEPPAARTCRCDSAKADKCSGGDMMLICRCDCHQVNVLAVEPVCKHERTTGWVLVPGNIGKSTCLDCGAVLWDNSNGLNPPQQTVTLNRPAEGK